MLNYILKSYNVAKCSSCVWFQCTLLVEIKSLVACLKSTLSPKIECRETECFQTK